MIERFETKRRTRKYRLIARLSWIDEQSERLQPVRHPPSTIADGFYLAAHYPRGSGLVSLTFSVTTFRWFDGWSLDSIHAMIAGTGQEVQATIDPDTGSIEMSPEDLSALSMDHYVMLEAMLARIQELAS